MPKSNSHTKHADIRYLVFSGAGAAFPGYAGAIKALEKESSFSFKNIRGVIGTSVGAPAALLVCLDYTPQQIEKKLLDIKLTELTGKRREHRLFTRYGIYSGHHIYQLILDILKERFPYKDARKVSFNDLKKAGYKDLYVVTVKMRLVNNIPMGKKVVFSSEYYGNTSVAAAILASTAASPGFEAVALKKDKARQKYRYIKNPDEQTDIFTDGGLLDNFAIKDFDKPAYMDPEELDNQQDINEIYNPHVLGLTPIAAASMVGDEHKPEKRHLGFNDPVNFYKGMLFTLTKSWQYQHIHEPGVALRTIEIARDISTFDFEESKKTIKQQIKYGQQAVRTFFRDKHSSKNKPPESPYQDEESDDYLPAKKNTCFNVCFSKKHQH